MPIPPLQLPDLELEGMSETDKAKLNEFLSQMVDKVNDIGEVVNKNHP